jgi:membrane protein implicated in regulation of membrane protease activity
LDQYLIWLIAGFVLVITEVVTGTFYLLVLGIAAFAGGLVAWAGGGVSLQAIAAAAVAVAGVLWVYRYRSRQTAKRMPDIDFGQPAIFETWVNRNAGHARVKYRDTLWDAFITADAAGQSAASNAVEPGEVLYIHAVDGNTLKVSKFRPA